MKEIGVELDGINRPHFTSWVRTPSTTYIFFFLRGNAEVMQNLYLKIVANFNIYWKLRFMLLYLSYESHEYYLYIILHVFYTK